MKFNNSTVAIGILNFGSTTKFIELGSPRDLQSRTFDQVVFIKDVKNLKDWYEAAYYSTVHSNIIEHRITHFKDNELS